jgi:hypothetical protein
MHGTTVGKEEEEEEVKLFSSLLFMNTGKAHPRTSHEDPQGE